ncbi:MAG: hypothetical protein O2897_06430, partial [bacterium]|nr:hypothetical protein [bacterium]
EHSRRWLEDKNFAPGTIISTDSISESWPSNSSVGEFKYNHIKQLQEKDFIISYGYGNAKTDIYAYSKAKIPAGKIFILGSYGGRHGTISVGEDFLQHLNKLISGENVV